MKNYHAIFISLLALFLFIYTGTHPNIAHAAACPLPGDTKIYVDPATNLCYSESDPLNYTGYNTIGGTRSSCGTGGQVRCPGSTTNLPNGNICIVKNGTQCFAGYGASGVYTPGCVAQSTTAIPCPTAKDALTLTIKVVDPQGVGISPTDTKLKITITYEDSPSPTNYVAGKTIITGTDSTGTATVKNTLYSGDHFSITASSPFYTITPARIGNLTNIGQEEMNTSFSCGTQLENGQNNKACTFTAVRNGVPIPNGNIASPAPAIVTDPTVDSAFSSVNQTLILLGVIGVIGVVVIGIGNGGGI